MARRRRIYFSSQASHAENEIPELDGRENQSFQNEEGVQPEINVRTPIQSSYTDYGVEARRNGREEPRENHTRLATRLTQLINSREVSELVGVFGMNSDNIVAETLENIGSRNSVFMGNIDVKGFGEDIYNCIAACLLEKVQERNSRNNSYYAYSNEYQVRRIYELLAQAYKGKNRDNYYIDYEDCLENLCSISEEQKRDLYLKDALELFQQVFFDSDVKFIFVISVDMQSISYKMVQMLSKLMDSNNIFIIQSLLDFNMQVRAFGAEFGYDSGDASLFFKFFHPNNIFSE